MFRNKCLPFDSENKNTQKTKHVMKTCELIFAAGFEANIALPKALGSKLFSLRN